MSPKPSHILVIRISAMGDVAMTIPVIERLLISNPELKLTVLTKAFFSPLFDGLPRTQVIAADIHAKHKGFFGIWKLAKELSILKIDYVADLHHVLRTRILCLFLFFHGIRSKHIDKGRNEKRRLVRRKNKVFKPLKTTHERYADVFQELGYQVDLSLPISKKKLPLSKEILTSYKIDFSKNVVGIAPFAAHKSKQYPISKMNRIILRIVEELNGQIVLFGGGKNEIERLEEIANSHTNVVSIAGKLSFKDELALISNLQLMISMDSGNGHLAAIFGVDVLTIWMGTHPYAGFAPFKQTSQLQFLPDLNEFDYLPNSVFGKKELKEYEAIAESINSDLIVEKIKKRLLRN